MNRESGDLPKLSMLNLSEGKKMHESKLYLIILIILIIYAFIMCLLRDFKRGLFYILVNGVNLNISKSLNTLTL